MTTSWHEDKDKRPDFKDVVRQMEEGLIQVQLRLPQVRGVIEAVGDAFNPPPRTRSTTRIRSLTSGAKVLVPGVREEVG